MIDKPDPKDAGRTDTGAKRPHATLDLKSTEVKPAQPATSASSASSSSAATASGSSPDATASASKPASSASASGSATPAPDAKPASAQAASSKSSVPPTATSKPAVDPKSSAAGTAATPVVEKRGGGFVSHLAAGIVGGGLVYAATAAGLPQLLGLPHGAGSDLAARVAALEAAPKEAGSVAELTARLNDADSRLAKVGDIEQRLAALDRAQGALQAETKSLAEAAQTGGDASGSAERLAKLEEQLRLIESSAPQGDARVPQVAALAGKITDLEAALANQVASLRKSIPVEVDERIAATSEASEAAKSAAQRLDRELAATRTDQARALQKVETQKADTDRLNAAVEAVREETGRLSSAVAELRSSIDSQLKAVARPADVTAAVGPVHSKIAELEQNVQTVVRSEQSRRENAERIVLSLELSNLKRALDRGQGQGYAVELEEVRKASAGQLDLAALERFKDTGVATEAQLKAEFRPVMNAVIDADMEPADGSVIDRLLAGAKSVVRVRKVSHEADDTSTEAIVARIEMALNDGRLGDVVGLAKTLPQRSQAPIEDWLTKVTARQSVDQAIAGIEGRLKASLSGAPDPAPAAPAPVQN